MYNFCGMSPRITSKIFQIDLIGPRANCLIPTWPANGIIYILKHSKTEKCWSPIVTSIKKVINSSCFYSPLLEKIETLQKGLSKPFMKNIAPFVTNSFLTFRRLSALSHPLKAKFLKSLMNIWEEEAGIFPFPNRPISCSNQRHTYLLDKHLF